MANIKEYYDVLVVGAGHAGCEAALASARLGMNTIIFTVSIESIALMPCNPNIGGSSKGHLVREIDALGGEMGRNTDKTFIQSKMLNKSKGPAVHSLRAQADKQDYTREMRKVLENTDGLTIRQGEITEIMVEEGKIIGAKAYSGAEYYAKAVILATGTYLKARCIFGDVSSPTGPNGLQAANFLTASLKQAGIEIRRFKTGTPARIDRRSIDFSKMEEQFGDKRVVPFSFTTDPESVQKQQVSCWLTYTNEQTHHIIRKNLDRSPLFSGEIEGTGPRYCPSIEDKVVKFQDKNRHQVFIEPEGNYTNEMYLGGMSSSMPEDVQQEMYRTVAGLENAKIVRNAYAIEYDCIDGRQLYATLEFKEIEGLYSAGQFNGSSGYEEAAAQGLIAGINAALKIQGREQLVLDRSQAYIGVLIDDLVTKESHEPYRMMTSRAEYRLLLRQDNADIRLTKIGFETGLINQERYQKLVEKERLIEKELLRLENTPVGANSQVQEFLEKNRSSLLKTGSSLAELIRRPELTYEMLAEFDPERLPVADDIVEQININIKYNGYIQRQMRQVEQFKKLENRKIEPDLDYDSIEGLRKEARQKLTLYRPASIGQAGRISGVSPADIAVLLVAIENIRRK
ncbi:tRNA uridine-5-carboxymethylaminomethyl(34) synthesis enzyme MnmG [Parasporobacterium paucivorans]|uniref:tRNA uridine 5-carboxymethylaminomethyl modification enzyme MnmG n=1 Tax=Parasporobacterium paucivorans DSM 15970 TaxID=1122934 RepID=A0A1M6B9D3_9FIRM|nr:tRNA uridine-5-carboxymethylaminomethyl(34) synthesis enzyme MnmG [Parasporobacterium paucivorans]SHI45296.1 tRNA uridine 5-carboxymethylaminomethyl modification enzyme [Parasporobacterium paucivorans DSM 15970]